MTHVVTSINKKHAKHKTMSRIYYQLVRSVVANPSFWLGRLQKSTAHEKELPAWMDRRLPILKLTQKMNLRVLLTNRTDKTYPYNQVPTGNDPKPGGRGEKSRNSRSS